jgi:hypothetical protein
LLIYVYPGNSKPRVVQAIESALTPKKTTKANTSKPRTTKVTTGRVTKPKTTTTTTTTTPATTTVKKPRTKTEKVVDTIVGKGEKVIGDVEGKPGKKVCFHSIPLHSTPRIVLYPLVKTTDNKLTHSLKAAGTRKARGTDSMTKRAAPAGRTKKAVV